MRDHSIDMVKDDLRKVIISTTKIMKSRHKECKMLPHTLEKTKKNCRWRKVIHRLSHTHNEFSKY